MEWSSQHKKTEGSPGDGQEVAKTKPSRSKRKTHDSDKEPINEQNLDQDLMTSRYTVKMTRLEQHNNIKGSPRAKTKTRSKRKVSEKATYSFKTLIEDVLLILFELLDPRDVAAMAQVEICMCDFVKRKYYPRIVLPLNQPHIMDNKRFILRIESNCSLILLENQLQNANLRKLKEIRMVVPNESTDLLGVNIYDALLIEIFLKSPYLKKVEMFVHSCSQCVLMKLPKKVNELCINFGDFPMNHTIPYIPEHFDENYLHHLSPMIQTALDQTNIQTLKLCNYRSTANVIKLESESLLSFEFQSVAKFVLKQLKFPNLTRLSVKDSIFAFSTSTFQGIDFFRYLDMQYARIDMIRVIYEECPKLTVLFGLNISGISRELGFEEWKKRFAILVREAADGEVEITRELCKSLKEFKIPGLEPLGLVYDSDDEISDLDDGMFGLEDDLDNSDEDLANLDDFEDT